MISFAAPLALFALACVPALIAVYLLRSRFRRTVVSSVMLWRSLSPPKKGGKKPDRLRFPPIFFLELAVIVLLALAAAKPMILSPGKSRPIAVVLDDSISMRANDNGETFRDKGLRTVEKIVREGRFSPIQLILAGQQPRILAQNARTLQEAVKSLEGWKCYAPGADLLHAIALAREMTEASVLVVTDHAPPEIDERIRWIAVGKPLPNAGFANAVRSDKSGKDRCLLEIANFSDSVLTTVKTGGLEEPLNLKPHGKKRLIINLKKRHTEFAAELEHDALAEDNRIVLYPPVTKKAGVMYDFADDKMKTAVQKAVDAAGTAKGGADILFTDMEAFSAGPGCWEVRFISGKKNKLYSGPFVADHAHPLLKGVSLDGVIWGADAGKEIPGHPIISVGNIPVFTEITFPYGKRRIRIRLNPEFSTLQKTPAWPGLIWNLLDMRIAEMPGPRRANARIGEDIGFPAGDEDSVGLTLPDKSRKQISTRSAIASVKAEEPGLYQIEYGGRSHAVSVNALCPGESDLSKCASGDWGRLHDFEAENPDFASFSSLLLLLALAGLAGHMIALSRKQGRP